jgi:hypothetical protein
MFLGVLFLLAAALGDIFGAVLGAAPAIAQSSAPVVLMTAGDGSVFLPYGEGLARYLAT